MSGADPTADATADATLGDILHLAHHAAADPRLWDGVMTRLQASLGAPMIVLIDHNVITHRSEISYAAGISARQRSLYRDRFSTKNVWLNARRNVMPGNVFTGAELVPNWELVRSEFYRDWLRPMRAFHCLIGVVLGGDEERRVLIALRPLDAAGFDAKSKRELGSLLTELTCASELGIEFMVARHKADILLDVMQTLSEAILVVDSDCRPVLLNRAAERLLAEARHLALVHGALATATGWETGKLRRLIADLAASASEGVATAASSEITIACESNGPALVLRATALPHAVVDRSGRRRYVAVLAASADVMDASRQLGRCYHLTPAETRLATLIIDGYSLDAAARQLQISRNTARTHMKRIYGKTSTHRQVDLVRLVAGGAIHRL